jgi:hypothetical protein
MRGNPSDVVIAGRLIDPPFACAEADVEIGDARRRSDEAFDPFIVTCDDARGPRGRESRGIEILAFRLSKLEFAG